MAIPARRVFLNFALALALMGFIASGLAARVLHNLAVNVVWRGAVARAYVFLFEHLVLGDSWSVALSLLALPLLTVLYYRSLRPRVILQK